MQRPGCRGVTTPRGFSGKRQRALTPSEELDGGLATAITILHITGIIAQVLLLQGVNCQGNGHFLLTKMLLDNPARQTNKRGNSHFGTFDRYSWDPECSNRRNAREQRASVKVQ